MSKKVFRQHFAEGEKKFQDHMGFMLYDPEEKKTIFEYQSDKYFTPASNTKILTLYTAMRTLGDSVPALEYEERNDSLIFHGTGDPSFLYKNVYTNSRVLDFLRSSKTRLYFSDANMFSAPFGPGWAWDDYDSYYSAERSALPIYGNIAVVTKTKDGLNIEPRAFRKNLFPGEKQRRENVSRELDQNWFYFHEGDSVRGKTMWEVPFKTSSMLTVQLLSDTLRRPVGLVSTKLPNASKVLYSIPSDSLYRVLMQDSDNFIAEQLLFLCAQVLRDSMQTESAIRYAKENYLNDLPDKLVWVDGSGLSRYNQTTPRNIVKVWEKLQAQAVPARLLPLLAAGGKNGTVKNLYKADRTFIFGKTGSLSNNHCLSGFIITRTGKTLIFSYMNSNFVSPVGDVRKHMETLLYQIYDKY